MITYVVIYFAIGLALALGFAIFDPTFDEVAAIVVFLLWPFAGILFAIYQFGNLIMLVGNTIRKLL